MANMIFPVFGVYHELLGQAYATSANLGDTVWSQARALGAKKYSVSEAAIKSIGVKLRNQVFLQVDESSIMPIPQLASESAEWLVAPPADTPSSMERILMSRLDAMDQRTEEQAKRMAEQAEQLSEHNKRAEEQAKRMAEQVEQLSEHSKRAEEQAKRMAEQAEQLSEHSKRAEEQAKRMAEQAEQHNKRAEEQAKRMAEQAEQISEHNKIMFWPLCIRQLCVLAADSINMQHGSKHGSGTIKPKSEAPSWAKDWLKSMGDSVKLDEADLAVIYVTTPGSTRGDANKAAHDIKEKDQAAAVRAVVDVQERASLARIFAFVYRHPVTDL